MAMNPRHAWPVILFAAALAIPRVAWSEPALDCSADYYDVLLTNAGTETMPPDTRILWNVRFVRHSGEFVLTNELAPGDTVFVSGALGSDNLTSPQPCVATAE